MEFLESIVSGGTINRVGWMLVHFVWQASAVALVLWFGLKLMKKSSANLRYLAGCGALIAVVLLPAVTFFMIGGAEAYIADETIAIGEGGAVGESVEAVEPGVVAVMPNIVEPVEIEMGVAAEMALVEESGREVIAAVSEKVSFSDRAAGVLEPVLPYMVVGWAFGVFGLSVWYLGGWTQLQRLRRRMVKPVDDCLRQRLGCVADKLGVGRAVEVFESALVVTPTVVGWLKPVILLPASVLTGFSSEQIEAILAHEIAHIKRCDYLVNMLQTCVEILGFYHPAVWWISKKIRAERENCCDDIAVKVCGDRIEYAKTLALFEGIRPGQSQLAVAASGSSLFERICRLIQKDSSGVKVDWKPSVIAVLLIMAFLIPAGFALTGEAKKGSDPFISSDGKEEWGDEVNGVQLGLKFRLPGRPFRQGEVVSAVIYARNNGDKPVRLSYIGLTGLTPVIYDAEGKAVDVTLPSPRWASGYIRRSVKAGETKEIGDMDIRVDAAAGTKIHKADIDYHAHLKSGTYHLGMKFLADKIPDNDWQSELKPGEIKLTIVRPDSVDVKELFKGISFEAAFKNAGSYPVQSYAKESVREGLRRYEDIMVAYADHPDLYKAKLRYFQKLRSADEESAASKVITELQEQFDLETDEGIEIALLYIKYHMEGGRERFKEHFARCKELLDALLVKGKAEDHSLLRLKTERLLARYHIHKGDEAKGLEIVIGALNRAKVDWAKEGFWSKLSDKDRKLYSDFMSELNALASTGGWAVGRCDDPAIVDVCKKRPPLIINPESDYIGNAMIRKFGPRFPAAKGKDFGHPVLGIWEKLVAYLKEETKKDLPGCKIETGFWDGATPGMATIVSSADGKYSIKKYPTIEISYRTEQKEWNEKSITGAQADGLVIKLRRYGEAWYRQWPIKPITTARGERKLYTEQIFLPEYHDYLIAEIEYGDKTDKKLLEKYKGLVGLLENATGYKSSVEANSPMSMAILPRSPIQSVKEYHHTYWSYVSSREEREKTSYELWVVSSDYKKLVRISDIHSSGIYGGVQLNGSQQRRAGNLEDGKYLVAVYSKGVRCSNIAELEIDADFDASKEPVLTVVPLPVGGGQKLPLLGIRAVGPEPEDPKLRNDSIAFPKLVVDGVERKLTGMAWSGPVRPLKSGQVYTRIRSLDDYEPAIEPGVKHTVKAIVGKYESEAVVIPADTKIYRKFDAAVQKLAPLPEPKAVIEGTVTGFDGKAGGGYVVNLFRKNDTSGVIDKYRETTGKDGKYRFENIPSGEYEVVCNYGSKARPDLKVKKVMVGADKTLKLNLSLQTHYKITGRVFYEGGKPAGKMDVTVVCGDLEGNLESDNITWTDAEGKYQIGVPFGNVGYVGVNGKRVKGQMPKLEAGTTVLNYELKKNKFGMYTGFPAAEAKKVSDPLNSKERKWSDSTIDFTLRVIEPTAQTPFIAEITIANRTDEKQSVPWPSIMPMCGDTNKNNIRVFDKDNKPLKIHGPHGDGPGRGSSEIGAKSSKTWRFPLETWFPGMANPGTYRVAPWYFSDHTKWSSWVGRVKMQPITVVRKEWFNAARWEKRHMHVYHLFCSYVAGEELPEEDTVGGHDKHPKLYWSDIPSLLEFAGYKEVIKRVPRLGISSYIQMEGRRGMVALWLIDALRKQQIAEMMELQGANGRITNEGLGLNPICLKGDMKLKECENSLEIHQEVLELYREWWRTVAEKTPGEAAIFDPLDLSDIQWYGRQQWEHSSDIEIFKKVTDDGAAGQRIIREMVYDDNRKEYLPSKKVRTIYYALKDPAEAKRPLTKEMLKVQKIVLHFYDDKGANIKNKAVFPSGKVSEEETSDTFISRYHKEAARELLIRISDEGKLSDKDLEVLDLLRGSDIDFEKQLKDEYFAPSGKAVDMQRNRAILGALGHMGTSRAREILIDIACTKQRGASMLGPRAVEELAKLTENADEIAMVLRSPDLNTRNAAAGAMANKPLNAAVVEALAKQLSSTSWYTHYAVAKAFGTDTSGDHAAKKIDALLANYPKLDGRIDDTDSTIKGSTMTPTEMARGSYVDALSKMKGGKLELIRRMAKASADQREALILALGRRGVKSIRPELLEIARNSKDGYVRKLAVYGMYDIATKDDMDFLRQLSLNDPYQKTGTHPGIDGRPEKYYPVRDAAKQVLEHLKKRRQPVRMLKLGDKRGQAIKEYEAVFEQQSAFYKQDRRNGPERDRVIEAFRKVIERYPLTEVAAWARMDILQLYFVSNDMVAAEAWYKEIIETLTSTEYEMRAHKYMGQQWLDRKGSPKKAIKYFQAIPNPRKEPYRLGMPGGNVPNSKNENTLPIEEAYYVSAKIKVLQCYILQGLVQEAKRQQDELLKEYPKASQWLEKPLKKSFKELKAYQEFSANCGKAVDGVQVCLRTFKTGERQEFRLGIRNSNEEYIYHYDHRSDRIIAIEFDGQWYTDQNRKKSDRPSRISPGKQFMDFATIELNQKWQKWQTKEGKLLKITPGKHTIRAKFAWGQQRLVIDKTAITNAVEIEIHSTKASGEEPKGSDAVPIKVKGPLGKVVELAVNLRNREYVDLDTATVFPYPRGMRTDTETMRPWEEKNGIDVYFGGSAKIVEIYERSMISAPVSDDKWNCTEEELMLEVKKAQWVGDLHPAKAVGNSAYLERYGKEVGSTFVFKTQRGNAGVLQIQDVTGKTMLRGIRGTKVKIRYWLLKNPTVKIADEQIMWGKPVNGIACAVKPVKKVFYSDEIFEYDIFYKNVSDRLITVCTYADIHQVWTQLKIFAPGGHMFMGRNSSGSSPPLKVSDFVTLKPGEIASMPKKRRGNSGELLDFSSAKKPVNFAAKVSISGINRIEQHIIGFDDICKKHNIIPWIGVIESGLSPFTVMPDPKPSDTSNSPSDEKTAIEVARVEQDAAAVADRYLAAMRRKGYAFLSSSELLRRRGQIAAFTVKHLRKPLDKKSRAAILEGIDHCIDRLYVKPAGQIDYGNGFGSGGEEWMYLNDVDYFLTFKYHLWVGLKSGPLASADERRRRTQQNWMRQYLVNLPFRGNREPAPRMGMSNDEVRSWALAELDKSFADPMGLLSKPMPDKGFAKLQDRFKRFSNGIAGDLQAMKVAGLTSRFVSHNDPAGRFGRKYTGQLPFDDTVVDLWGNGPSLHFASNADFRGSHGLLSQSGVYDVVRYSGMQAKPAPSGAARDAWLAREGRGDLVLDGSDLIAVRGAKMAKLQIKNWFDADKLSDDQLRTVISNSGTDSISIKGLPRMNGPHRGDRSEGEFFIVVQTSENRMAIINLHNYEFGQLMFWCRKSRDSRNPVREELKGTEALKSGSAPMFYYGLDLSKAPIVTDKLWHSEEYPAGSGKYRRRKDIVRVHHDYGSTVYYESSKNRFYIQRSTVKKEVVYGPLKGVPREVLKFPAGKGNRETIAAVEGESGWGVEVSGLKCSVEMAAGDYRVGDPVVINVKIKNVTDKPINFYYQDLYAAESLIVENQKGEAVKISRTDVQYNWPLGKEFIRLIKPGETFTHKIKGRVEYKFVTADNLRKTNKRQLQINFHDVVCDIKEKDRFTARLRLEVGESAKGIAKMAGVNDIWTGTLESNKAVFNIAAMPRKELDKAIKLLGSGNDEEITEAIEVLGANADKKAVRGLMEIIKGGNNRFMRKAGEALVNIQDTSIVPELEDMYEKAAPNDRTESEYKFVVMNALKNLESKENANERFMKVLKSDAPYNEIYYAAEQLAIAAYEPALPAMIELAKSSDTRRRRAAISTLQIIGHRVEGNNRKLVVECLVDRMKNEPDPEVRKKAVEAAARVGGDSVSDDLVELLKDSEVAFSAAIYLGTYGSAKALGPLQEYADKLKDEKSIKVVRESIKFIRQRTGGDKVGGLECSVKMSTGTYRVGDPVVIDVAVKNTTDKDVNFYYDDMYIAKNLVIKNSKGGIVASNMTAVYGPRSMGYNPFRLIKPGKTFAYQIKGRIKCKFVKAEELKDNTSRSLVIDFRDFAFNIEGTGKFTARLGLEIGDKAKRMAKAAGVEDIWTGTLESNEVEFNVAAMPREELDEAIKTLSKGNDEEIAEAIQVLSANADKKAAGTLMEIVKFGRGRHIRKAADALIRIQDTSLVPELIVMHQGPAPYEKTAGEYKQIVLSVIRALENKRNFNDRLHEIVESGASVDETGYAVWELAGAKYEPAIPAMIELAKKRNPRKQWAAIDALGNFGERVQGENKKLIIESLLEIMKNDPDRTVRSRAVGAAARAGGKSVVPELVKALKDPNKWVRSYAATYLGRHGGVEAIGPLQEYEKGEAEEKFKKIARKSIESIRQRTGGDKVSANEISGGISWGKAVGGLELGLERERGMPRIPIKTSFCLPGDLVDFRVYVRNVSDKTVKVVHNGTAGLEPEVLNPRWQEKRLERLRNNSRQKQLSLRPGEIKELGPVYLQLGNRPELKSQRLMPDMGFYIPPDVRPRYLSDGRYEIEQKFSFVKSDEATFHGELTSGKVPISVSRPARRRTDFIRDRKEHYWGIEVEGLQLGLKGKGLKVDAGDQIILDIYLRNRGERDWSIYWKKLYGAYLKVDGDWYRKSSIMKMSEGATLKLIRSGANDSGPFLKFKLAAGENRQWLRHDLSDNSEKSTGKPSYLNLKPGCHEVQLYIPAMPFKEGLSSILDKKRFGVPSLPFEIEIVPEDKPVFKITPDSSDSTWKELGGDDQSHAYRAVKRLCSAGDAGVELIAKRIEPDKAGEGPFAETTAERQIAGSIRALELIGSTAAKKQLNHIIAAGEGRWPSVLARSALIRLEKQPSGPSVETFGSNRGMLIYGGYVFFDGKYIPAPYVVERWGADVYINGVKIRDGYEDSFGVSFSDKIKALKEADLSSGGVVFYRTGGGRLDMGKKGGIELIEALLGVSPKDPANPVKLHEDFTGGFESHRQLIQRLVKLEGRKIPTTLNTLQNKKAKKGADALKSSSGWGKAVKGVQIRVGPDDQEIAAGSLPEFTMDVRNNGKEEWQLGLVLEQWRIQVEGVWYFAGAAFSGDFETLRLGPGQMHKGIKFTPEERWNWNYRGKPLKFTPGVHIIRLSYSASGPLSEDIKKRRYINLESKPVSVEVLAEVKKRTDSFNSNAIFNSNSSKKEVEVDREKAKKFKMFGYEICELCDSLRKVEVLDPNPNIESSAIRPQKTGRWAWQFKNGYYWAYCPHKWKEGFSSAIDKRVDDGQVVLVKQGDVYGAFILTGQSPFERGVFFTWCYGTDDKGVFNTGHPSVKSSKSPQFYDLHSEGLKFGPFDPIMCISKHVYYRMIPGDDSKKEQIAFCVTYETSFDGINPSDKKWVYRRHRFDAPMPGGKPVVKSDGGGSEVMKVFADLEAAIKKNDSKKMAAVFHPDLPEDKRRIFQKFHRILLERTPKDFDASPMVLVFNGDKITAISRVFKLSSPDKSEARASDPYMSVISLEKYNGQWKITSYFPYWEPKRLPAFYKTKLKLDPDTRFWFADDTPDWLRYKPEGKPGAKKGARSSDSGVNNKTRKAFDEAFNPWGFESYRVYEILRKANKRDKAWICKKIVERFNTEPNPDIRGDILLALKPFEKECRRLVAQALLDEDRNLRCTASIVACNDFFTEDELEPIYLAAKKDVHRHGHYSIAYSCINAMGNIGGEKAAGLLTKLLDDKDFPNMHKGPIPLYLGFTNSSKGFEVLESIVNGKRKNVNRAGALTGLVMMASYHATDPPINHDKRRPADPEIFNKIRTILINEINSDDPYCRISAASGFGVIGGKKDISFIEPLLKDKFSKLEKVTENGKTVNKKIYPVREETIKAIAEIRKREKEKGA